MHNHLKHIQISSKTRKTVNITITTVLFQFVPTVLPSSGRTHSSQKTRSACLVEYLSSICQNHNNIYHAERIAKRGSKTQFKAINQIVRRFVYRLAF